MPLAETDADIIQLLQHMLYILGVLDSEFETGRA